MTEATPLASEQITQEDRFAAASLERLQKYRDAILEGRQDQSRIVRAFARHRIAALSASPAPSGQGVSGERLALEAIKAVTATTKDAVAGLSRIMAITRSAGVTEPYSELMARPEVALLVSEPRTEWRHLFEQPAGCTIPPAGWRCTRTPGHDGPCAAVPAAPAPSCAPGEVERIARIIEPEVAWDASNPLHGVSDFVARREAAREKARQIAAPAPLCAPGEVEAILARLPDAPWRVTRSLLADFGASLEVDNESNFGNIGHIRDYDTACALADLVREAAAFTTSNKTANMDAVISILKRHWPATPFMHKNCANAILAALSPQGLDAKEGGKPVAWVSPGQLAAHNPGPNDNRYLPVVKESGGNFTMPLYATPSQRLDVKEGGE